MELVLEARRALEGRIRRTPIEVSAALSDAAKVPVFLKLESLQLTGSFKIRGAFFALPEPLRRRAPPRHRHVLGRKSRQGGRLRRARARRARRDPRSPQRRRVQVPGHARPRRERRPLRRSTASTRPSSSRKAEAARTRRRFVTAFDDDLILAANGGTLAAEMLEDCLAARTFLLPVGGAGLAGGFAFYAKTALPDSRIVGCQHALSPALALSLERGEAVLEAAARRDDGRRPRGRHRQDRLRRPEGPHRRRRAASRRARSSTPCASCSTSTST